MSEINLTPPAVPESGGFVHSLKEFSDTLTLDLTDEEIAQTFKVLLEVITKWQNIFRSKMISSYKDAEDIIKDTDRFESEIKERLESLSILASVDVMPVIEGTGYPTIVLEGALPSHYSAKYGADHEKKTYEVRKAKEKGEVFLGASNIQ